MSKQLNAIQMVKVSEMLRQAGYYRARVIDGTVGKDWSGDRIIAAETNIGEFIINLETGIVTEVE